MLVIARMMSSRRSTLIGGIRQPGFSVALEDASTTAAKASSTFCSTYQCRLFSGAGGRQKDSKGSSPTRLQLLDEDVEERFVKGSGPGGQKINKVRNCVQLTHKPTGISVSCQDSRDLTANRHIARKRLSEKVEFQLRGDDSKTGRRIAKIRNKKARAQRKARLKYQGAATTGNLVDMADSSAPTGEENFGDISEESFQQHCAKDIDESDDANDGSETKW